MRTFARLQTPLLSIAGLCLIVLLLAPLRNGGAHGANNDDGQDQQLDFEGHQIVDLTHPFDEQTIFWPTEPGFKLEVAARGVTEKGYFYAANRFRSAEHGGTHLDAPFHFQDQRRTVEQIPIEQLMGRAAVIDVTEQCRANVDYQITIDDLHGWEQQHQQSLDNMIVLLRTGFARYWPDRQRYLGTDERGTEAVAKLHFPGLSPDAARWVAHERRVKAIGIDTASIDYGQSGLFESHRTLFERNIPVFENIGDLNDVPALGATVVALPMKIAGGTGAPLRIIAILPH